MDELIRATPPTERLVSVISCWEVGKLAELHRLSLPMSVGPWLERATHPGTVQIVPLTLPIIVDATSLPPGFHKDPADQLIVATARTLSATLLSIDEKIRSYEHVRTLT